MKKNKTYFRREFLKIALGVAAASALPLDALAAALKGFDARRTLSFYNTHTGEQLNACYFSQGAYNKESLSKIDFILRDHRSGEVKPIDAQLLDLLFALKSRIRSGKPFHVISGYRSPATNEMLRQNSQGVAKVSYHTLGQAIDIRLPGYDTLGLRNHSVKLGGGGVGYYARSDFVHLDIGPVRAW
jgi:uncharacterized protein YcbK (DUF882 family)